MVPLRLLIYNTYLLRALALRLGPWHLDIGAKPDWAERAEGIGPAVAGQHDVLALCEVFADQERDTIARGWAGAAGWPAGTLPIIADGPARGGLAGQSSGLRTLVDPTGPCTVTRREVLVFRSRGKRWLDADALANKGALMTEIDVGLPGRLELVTSHLLAGGGLWPMEPRRDEEWARYRAEQVAEIVAFIERVHQPGNVLALGGDLNIAAEEPGRPSPEYQNLVSALGACGLADQWPRHGVGPGWTSDLASLGSALGEPDPEHPDWLLDEPTPPRIRTPEGRTGERIDYLFLQEPQPEHRIKVELAALHRLPFHRGPATASRRLDWLSDHVALGADLHMSGS